MRIRSPQQVWDRTQRVVEGKTEGNNRSEQKLDRQDEDEDQIQTVWSKLALTEDT